jgi:acetyltransferase-like isoleucine patch superfamily enzyme
MRKIKLLIKLILFLPIRIFSKISAFALIDESSIDHTSAVDSGCRIYHSKIGRYTCIARNCTVAHSEIGSFCSIADNVMISPGKHPLLNVSTSPVFYSKQNLLRKCFVQMDFNEFDKTIIGNDVWIGTHAFIKGGIIVGNGSVIGAYTIVTKDVEPYSIVVGNPGKVIKKRFDNATISKLLNSKWWEFDNDALQKKAVNISDIEKFLE